MAKHYAVLSAEKAILENEKKNLEEKRKWKRPLKWGFSLIEDGLKARKESGMTREEKIEEILRIFDGLSREEQQEIIQKVAEIIADGVRKNGDEV